MVDSINCTLWDVPRQNDLHSRDVVLRRDTKGVGVGRRVLRRKLQGPANAKHQTILMLKYSPIRILQHQARQARLRSFPSRNLRIR